MYLTCIMKFIGTSILFFFAFLVVNAQETVVENNGMRLLSAANSRIVRTEISVDSTGIERTKAYDIDDSIVKITTRDLWRSLGLMVCRVDVFNAEGRHVLEQISDVKGVLWHQYTFRYDTLHRLIEKEGFSSGEIGEQVLYFYQEDRLIRVDRYRFGELVKSTSY